MSRVETQVLWSNAGRNPLSGLSSAKLYFPTFGTFEPGEGEIGIADDSWHRIPCAGADKLDLTWQQEIIDVGGIGGGAVTASNVRITAIGLPHEDIVPSIISGSAAAAIGSKDLENYGLQMRTHTQKWQQVAHTNDNLLYGEYAMTPVGVFPANGQKVHWGLHPRMVLAA